MAKTTAERFWAKVNKDGLVPAHRPELGPCWEWTGALNEGYGRFRVGERNEKAYRWAFEDAHGPIPDGLEPDHLCRNRACIKSIADEHGPAHLQIVTSRENTLRGETIAARNAAKTHCPRGHPFDEANTYSPPRGGRECRTCTRERQRATD